MVLGKKDMVFGKEDSKGSNATIVIGVTRVTGGTRGGNPPWRGH